MAPQTPRPAFAGIFDVIPTFRQDELIYGSAGNGVLAKDGLRAWRHVASGVRIVLFNTPGPITSANIVVGTIPISDGGHPHILEHMVFLGSHKHPERGYLDTLANRCLADGTNAYTEVDFTVYQAEGAGFEGLSRLLPVFVDHVLRPNISENAFKSEVYYTNSQCKEAGVVFCEMHGREHTEDDLAMRSLYQVLYPDNPLSLSSGGICEDIRKLTTEDIQRYHDEYYVGHNVSIVVGGADIDSNDLLASLCPILDDIARTDKRPRKRIPWELEAKLVPLPPVTQKQVNFPCPDEDIGSVVLAWRGPPGAHLLEKCAIEIFMKYLVDNVSSPLRQKFVECDNPLSNYVTYDIESYLATSKLALVFMGVSHDEADDDEMEDEDDEEREDGDESDNSDEITEHKSEQANGNHEEDDFKSMLTSGEFSSLVMEYLQSIFDEKKLPCGGLEAVHLTIKRERESYLAGLEEDSHELVPNLLIEEVLYGDVIDVPIGTETRGYMDRLATLESKDETFWLNVLEESFLKAPRVELFMTPDCTLAEKLAEADVALANKRIKKYGKDKLVAIGVKNEEAIKKLEKAVFTADDFPPVPSALNVSRCPYSVQIEERREYFAQSLSIESAFVSTSIFWNTEKLTFEQRLVLPLLYLLHLNTDVKLDDGAVVPYAQNSYAISSVTVESDMSATFSGFTNGLAHHCLRSHFTSTLENCDEAYALMCRAIFKEVVTPERLSTVAKNLISDITEDLRSPGAMLGATAGLLPYLDTSEDVQTDVRTFPNFTLGNIIAVRELVSKITGDGNGDDKRELAKDVAIEKVCALLNDTLHALRTLQASDIFVQIGARDPAQWHGRFAEVWNSYRLKVDVPLPSRAKSAEDQVLPIRRVLPRYDLSGTDKDVARIVGVPGAENAYFDIRISADVYPGHQDWGPLVVLNELLSRMEGPLSDAIRKSGLAYDYGLNNNRWKGYILASIDETSSPCQAWVAMCDKLIEVRAQLAADSAPLSNDLATAISVSVYGLNTGRATPEHVVKSVLCDAALECPSSPVADRALEESVEAVQLPDLLDVFDRHIARLFKPDARRAVLTCGPSAVASAIEDFANCKYPLSFVECRPEEIVPAAVSRAVANVLS